MLWLKAKELTLIVRLHSLTIVILMSVFVGILSVKCRITYGLWDTMNIIENYIADELIRAGTELTTFDIL